MLIVIFHSFIHSFLQRPECLFDTTLADEHTDITRDSISMSEIEVPVQQEGPATSSTAVTEAKSRMVSVYHLYTPFQRRLILICGGLLALLTPFTDTVYLPALNDVKKNFETSDSMVALTVSVYLACVGVGQLIWGPLSDRYGRQIVLVATLVVYLGITLGCIFSPNVGSFLVLRSIQVSQYLRTEFRIVYLSDSLELTLISMYSIGLFCLTCFHRALW
jgi:hypothetical protein